jgi:hypothetical protein
MAGDITPGQAVAAGALALAQNTPQHEFVGGNKCKKCHIATYKSWEETAMGKSMETLKPGVSAEKKTKFGLDPQKDYTTDEGCLKCHTTGYGHAGGYAIPDASDKKAVRKAKKLANVGCESCHGPGGGYIDLHTEIFKSKRKYKAEEMHAAGMWKIEEANCLTCHNDQGPTHAGAEPWDFEAMKKKSHEHIELKLRE